MSLILPFAGVGAGAANGGCRDVLDCTCTGSVPVASALGKHGSGGGRDFGNTDSLLVTEGAAFAVRAASNVIRLGGGGLMQSAWAGATGLVATGNRGTGHVSSSLSNSQSFTLV